MTLEWAWEISGRHTPPEDDPQTYWMSFLRAAVPWDCPADGCRGRVAKRSSLRVNLLQQNIRYTVIIL